METLLSGLIEGLSKFGPHVVTTGLFVGYLVLRDRKMDNAPEKAAGEASDASKSGGTIAIRQYQVEQAVLEIAKQTALQTKLLEQCVEGHTDTRLALMELKTKLDVRQPPPTGRH